MATDSRKVAFAMWLSRLQAQVLADEVTPEFAAERLRRAADAVAKWGAPQAEETPEAAAKRLGAGPREVREIHDFVCRTRGRALELTSDRKKVIKKALSKFSPAQLRHVAVWVTRDDYSRGDNPAGKRWDKPEHMFDSVERIEDYLERSNWHDDATVTAPEQQALNYDEIARLQDERRAAMRAGRTADAQAAERQIRKLRGSSTAQTDGEARGHHGLRVVNGDG